MTILGIDDHGLNIEICDTFMVEVTWYVSKSSIVFHGSLVNIQVKFMK